MNLTELIKIFYENNREIVSLIDNNDLKKTKKQLKKYNLEFDVYIEDEITKHLIYLTNYITNERIVVACLKKTREVFFEYSSNEISITEVDFKRYSKIPENGKFFSGWDLLFDFNDDNESIELKHNHFKISGRTPDMMKQDQKMFDLLCKQIEKYDIKILKLLTGDNDYLASIDFNMIFLENDNNILKDFCENEFIFNSLNINKYIIEKKDSYKKNKILQK